MYNTLFGFNSVYIDCLTLINQPKRDIERFRDAILVKDKKYGYIVEILTRTGGENRKTFKNENLLNNPNYIKDYDDDYDSTYAHYLFIVNESMLKICDIDIVLRRQTRQNLNLKKMFKKEFKEMNKNGTDANKRAKTIANGFKKLLESNNSKSINFVTIEDIMELGKKGEN